jgi:hypothetical protein
MSSQSSGKAKQKRAARERVEQMRREQEVKDRRQRALILGGTGVAAVGIIVVAVVAVSNERSSDTPPGALPTVAADGRTTEPPWSLPSNPAALAESVGLRVAPMEGTAKHFHTHLDVIVDGEPVTLPANIGIDPSGNGMSELHTHDERGVLHVEAPSADMRYTLGQVFAEWDVRLDSEGVGGLEADDTNTLRAYVDGELFEGDPTNIELEPRGQIALVYGPADEDVDVPDSFAFEPGE